MATFRISDSPEELQLTLRLPSIKVRPLQLQIPPPRPPPPHLYFRLCASDLSGTAGAKQEWVGSHRARLVSGWAPRKQRSRWPSDM